MVSWNKLQNSTQNNDVHFSHVTREKCINHIQNPLAKCPQDEDQDSSSRSKLFDQGLH